MAGGKTKEGPLQSNGPSFRMISATTYSPTFWAVPSAQWGLTSLFGMGRGGTPTQ